MLEALDRLVLSARRRSRRRRRERDLRALPGYSPAPSETTALSGLKRRSVAVCVAATLALTGLPALGYGVAAEMDSRASQSRYEVADREFAEASAAYSAAMAVEMERSEVEPENALEYVRSYGDPETDTARQLQGELEAAADDWSEAAGET